jgi:hypothetical protein
MKDLIVKREVAGCWEKTREFIVPRVGIVTVK